MMNKFLFWLSSFLPCRLIKLDSGPYLERYYVGQLFGVTFYLHRFVSSDSERHMHNHPWGWGRALVLCGRYVETSVIDICPHANVSGALLTRRYIRWWNRVDGNHFHQISDAAPGTWTLFFHGPRLDAEGNPVTSKQGATKLKGWGFLERERYTADGYVTVFVPYDSASNLRWWHKAPLGRDIDRVPYAASSDT